MNYYRLDEICEINPKKTISNTLTDEISFIPMDAVSTDGKIDTSKTISVKNVKNYTIFRNGDILFAKITPCMENGKGAIAAGLKNGYGAGSTEFIVLRPDTEKITQKWLQLFLSQKSFRLYCQQNMTGSAGQKRVPPKFLATCVLPVPTLEMQERIISQIEELFSQLDSGVATLKKIKQQLAVYRQAVLKEAFKGAFTAHKLLNIRLDWAEQKEIISMPPLPDEWRYIALSKLGDFGRGKSKHRPRNDAILFENGKYPFIQTGDVKAAKHNITEWSKMYGEIGLKQSKLWPKGTLCITISANIAETAFLGIDACFPDSVVGFTPFDFILSEYVRYFIESQKVRLWAYAPATAQKNINLDTLENLIVPYCSFEEQKEVVSEIESRMTICDSIEQTVNTALQQAEVMRQSILKKVFEGGLL